MRTNNIIFFSIKKKITLNYPKSVVIGFFFQLSQERVRNSRGKRAISVQATEGLLYPKLWRFSSFEAWPPNCHRENVKKKQQLIFPVF